MSVERVDDGIMVAREGIADEEIEQVDELLDILREEWNYSRRAQIRKLYPSSNADRTVIIQWEEAGQEKLLGGYTDSLLKHGWVITGLKTRMTFVGPITPAEDDADGDYQIEGRDETSTYGVKPCAVCEEREYVEHVNVEVDVDVEKLLEDGKTVPRIHSRPMRLCNECSLPEEFTEYEFDGEPDFKPQGYPEYFDIE